MQYTCAFDCYLCKKELLIGGIGAFQYGYE